MLFLLIFVVLVGCNQEIKDPGEEISNGFKRMLEKGKEENQTTSKSNPKKEEEQKKNVDWLEKLPKQSFIDAPHLQQMPELARGCEVTSLAMLLQYANVNVDKMTLAKEIKKDSTPYQVKNGEVYFGNPHNGFVGDIYTFDKKGYAVYNEPVYQLGNQYLPNGLVNLSGESFKKVYESLAKEKPVWVITTSTFDVVQTDEWEKWNTPSGEIYVTLKEHAVLLTGYDEQYIYFNNPLGEKNEKVEKETFIIGWEQLGNQAITLK